MQSTYLTTSTGSPEGFSGGLLLSDSTAHWNLDRSSTWGVSSNCFGWHVDQEDAGATFFHGVVLRTTAGIPQYDRNILMRLACHFILSRLSDDGLPDLFQSLAEDYYYQTLLSQQSDKPSRSYKLFEANQGPRDARPVFRVTED